VRDSGVPKSSSRPVPSGVVAPRQERGRATQRAILRAFRRLLTRRSFVDVTVRDIVDEAGCSIGAFYTRFASKEALLVPLVGELTADATQALAEATRPRSNLEEQVGAYVETMVDWFARNRRVLSEAIPAARGTGAAEIGALLVQFNTAAHSAVREALRAHTIHMATDSAAAAIEYGLFFASAAARDGVTQGMWNTYEVSPTPGDLAREITRAWVAYLRAGEGRAR